MYKQKKKKPRSLKEKSRKSDHKEYVTFWGLERAHITDDLIGANQEIPD